MTPAHYLAVSVRVFSIFIFIFGVWQSSFFIELLAEFPRGVMLSWAYAVGSSALPIIMAVIL